MRRYRILPGKVELNRLYWLDGMSIKRIAAQYQVYPSSVASALKRHGIPIRPRGRRIASHCCDCHRMVCQVKRWKTSGSYWCYTNRCAMHFHLKRRLYYREYFRKQEQPRQYRYQRKESAGNAQRKPIGMLGIIRRAA